MSPSQLAILGFGTMGQALASGLVATGTPAQAITAVDRHRSAAAPAQALGIAFSTEATAATRAADRVLLCVKPKELPGLLEHLRSSGALDHRPLVVSIAAGVRLESLEAALPGGTPVIRAMPNTPCAVRQGMTVLAPGRAATEDHLAAARRCFEPLGRVLDLEERHMDAVTGLSASGPAFIFVILEALAEGGVQCGLPRTVALELAAQMTLGAASMVLQTGQHPAALKDQVTTPAGCTIAGLLALEDGRIRSVVARGIERATQVAAGLG